jgi:hypothetical protein
VTPGFVEDGPPRLYDSPEFQARLQALKAQVRARYATEWAKAGLWRRLILRWRIAAEFRKEREKLEPSPESLYGLDGAIQDVAESV